MSVCKNWREVSGRSRWTNGSRSRNRDFLRAPSSEKFSDRAASYWTETSLRRRSLRRPFMALQLYSRFVCFAPSARPPAESRSPSSFHLGRSLFCQPGPDFISVLDRRGIGRQPARASRNNRVRAHSVIPIAGSCHSRH